MSNSPRRESSPVGARKLVSSSSTVLNKSRFSLTVSLGSPSPTMAQALLNSGADGNFIDSRFCSQLGLALETLDFSLSATTLNGRLLKQITHRMDWITALSRHFRATTAAPPQPSCGFEVGEDPQLERRGLWLVTEVSLASFNHEYGPSRDPTNPSAVPTEYNDLAPV